MRLSPLLAILPLAAFAAPSIAQTTFTSPSNADTVDGNSSVLGSQVFGGANRRYQFILGDVTGTPRPNINAVDWRTDRAHASVYAARTMTLSAVMAHGSLATATTTFATNYSGAPTTVINARTFNLPASSGVPTTPNPQPWTINFPFDSGSNFSYDGVQDLVFEVVVTGVTPIGSYSLDCQTNVATVTAGTGSYPRPTDACIASNQSTTRQDIWIVGTIPYSIPNITLNHRMTAGPISAPGVLVLGLQDLNTNLNGQLCGFLRPSLDITLPVVTDATGNIASAAAPLAVTFRHPGVAVGIRTQFGILDAGRAATELGVSLSDSILWNVTLPTTPTPRRGYTASTSTATTGFLTSSFIPVMRFTY